MTALMELCARVGVQSHKAAWRRMMKTWILLAAAALGMATAHGESPVVVTYSHGILHAAIPYSLPHAGAGQLTLELLDPEGRALGRTERLVPVNKVDGWWREDLKLTR